VQRIIDSTRHTITGYAPATLVFGPRLNLNRTLVLNSLDHKFTTLESWLHDTDVSQSEDTRNAQVAQARASDARRLLSQQASPPSFQVDDLVLIAHPAKQTKFRKWLGPYKITHIEHDAVTATHLATLRSCTVHIHLVKPYVSSTTSPTKVAAADADEYEVDHIVSHVGTTKKTLRFKIRWTGYGESSDSYLSLNAVKDLAALDTYLLIHPELEKFFKK
jgi:hypothetical protein